jgi:hypothetical protein
MTFALWLEQVGPVILRPRFCDDTVDMFNEGVIPALTIHSPHDAPVETTLTGDALMIALTTTRFELQAAMDATQTTDPDDQTDIDDVLGGTGDDEVEV